ncbi:Uncharacterised protein [uncultured archaeon]|nr:Uncharacterised protein [uncultured archaeon]
MLDGKLLIGGKWKNGDRTFESERAKIFTMIGDELLKRSHEISKLITLDIKQGY